MRVDEAKIGIGKIGKLGNLQNQSLKPLRSDIIQPEPLHMLYCYEKTNQLDIPIVCFPLQGLVCSLLVGVVMYSQTRVLWPLDVRSIVSAH